MGYAQSVEYLECKQMGHDTDKGTLKALTLLLFIAQKQVMSSPRLHHLNNV